LCITALCTTFLAVSSKAYAKTLYLDPGVWDTSNAKFAAYYFNAGETGTWTSDYLTEQSDETFKAEIPDGYTTVIFCRMNPAGGISWDYRWDQTQDLTIPTDGKNLYTITSQQSGTNIGLGQWSVYTPGTTPGPDPTTPTDYGTAVPSECEDVMLQAFYWDSYQDKGYGNTKWTTLKGQVDEIASSFSLVWLPPSAQSQGGLGYIPNDYSTQSSTALGKKADLQALLSAFHSKGVKVLADIVINHCGNNSSACDYKYMNFGEYGSFSPKSTWMTSNDEGVTSYHCTGGANADDGQHEANYGAARDWDHKNPEVQAMCKAYLQWMRNVMLYDGFRYDYSGGYHVSHVNDYNQASKPYFTVMEYWDGDANNLKTRIDQANKNTLTFDFAAKYNVFRDGIYLKNYSKCAGTQGLRGKGYSKYAVTFIDNHDTFARGSDNEDVAGKRDGSSVNDKSLMMRCNAYLLAMPGVPCVFYPHWVKYKTEIKAMIRARRAAGIHSESTVEETSGGGWYRATIKGKYGYVKVMLGTAASDAAPSGYTQAVKGSDYAMYYTGNGTWAVEHIEAEQSKGDKFIQDGQLFIRCGDRIYDAQGRLIQR